MCVLTRRRTCQRSDDDGDSDMHLGFSTLRERAETLFPTSIEPETDISLCRRHAASLRVFVVALFANGVYGGLGYRIGSVVSVLYSTLVLHF